MRAVRSRILRRKSPVVSDQSSGRSNSCRRPSKYSSSSRRTSSSSTGASSTRGDNRSAKSSSSASRWSRSNATRTSPRRVAANSSRPTAESVSVYATSTRPSAWARRANSLMRSSMCPPLPYRRQTRAHVLARRRLTAIERRADLGIVQIRGKPQEHRRALLVGQPPDRPPQRRLAFSIPNRCHLWHLLYRNWASSPSPVHVERLSGRDLKQPRSQVGGVAQLRIRPKRRQERLLERVLCVHRPDRRGQEPEQLAGVPVEQQLKGRQLHIGRTRGRHGT